MNYCNVFFICRIRFTLCVSSQSVALPSELVKVGGLGGEVGEGGGQIGAPERGDQWGRVFAKVAQAFVQLGTGSYQCGRG